MEQKFKGIRPFIGAKDYELSRKFYNDLGFHEVFLSRDMSLFQTGHIGFYLQNAYVRDWVDNTMVFIEVEDVEAYWKSLLALDLTTKYPGAKLTPIHHHDWGSECYLHDPCGILWHFGQFNV